MKKIFNVGDTVKVIHVDLTDNVDGIDANDTGVVVMAGNIILVKMDKNGQIYQFYKYQLSNLTTEKLAEI